MKIATLYLALLACSCSEAPEKIGKPTYKASIEIEGTIFDPINIRFQELDYNSLVNITLVRDWGGRLFCGWATFDPPRDGRLDLALSPPKSGSYIAADSDGLFWSARPCDSPEVQLSANLGDVIKGLELSSPEDYVLLTEQNRTHSITKFHIPFEDADAVSETHIEDGGSDVILSLPRYSPPASVRLIWIGGSSGGHSYRIFSARSAELGYISANIAYFGTERTPKKLANIEIANLANSIEIIKNETPSVEKTVIIGVSRGAEAAVVLADQVKADGLVLISPNAYFWGAYRSDPDTPAWLLNGVAFPFVNSNITVSLKDAENLPDPYWAESFRAQFLDRTSPRSKALARQIYALNNPEETQLAALPIDQLSIPISVHVGMDDQLTGLWAAATLMNRNTKARKGNLSSHSYEKAGHAILGSGKFPRTEASTPLTGYTNGGTAEADSLAQKQLWKDLQVFFEQF